MGFKTIYTKFDFEHMVGMDPKFLDEILSLGGWVGGSIALRLLDKYVIAHDVDIFCPDMQTFYTLKHYLWSHPRFAGKFKDLDRYIEFRMVDEHKKHIKRPVQLVRPNLTTYGIPDSVEDILNRMDFSVCRILITAYNQMIIDEDLPEHLAERKLVCRLDVKSELEAKRAMWRYSKYIAKGFIASKYDLIKILSYLKDVPRETLTSVGRVMHTQEANILCDDGLKKMYDEFMEASSERNGIQESLVRDEFIKSEEEWQNGNAQPWKGLA